MSASDRWSRVEALYHAARERDAGERAAFLDAACGGDAELRGDVESLLAEAASADGFLGKPAVAFAAELITNPGATVLTGRRVGAYQLQALLGVGGMGEVYRARDTKLGRDVAIKILPRVFTSDPERLTRFEREARMLAALNHPHIGAIYGVEEAEGLRALVLELVEGDTLADRLQRGPVPVAETLTLAHQIAEALEAAHEKGVIHRDLKPANIKVTPEGSVKVLDFGLAKALAPASDDALTLTTIPTKAGAILGTSAYMSPEQARGEAADRQADIWSFGVVLYELLTGTSAFGRRTTAETLASVLGTQPDYSVLPAATPATVRRLVRRCLEKDKKRRLQHMGDVRIEVEEALAALTADVAPGPTAPVAGNGRMRWAASAIALAVLAGVAGWWLASRSAVQPPAAVARLSIASLERTLALPFGVRHLAISDDGSRVAYAAMSRLWIRRMGQTEAVAIEVSAANPFFSPNGEWVGFFDADRGVGLRKVSVRGGSPVTIVTTSERPAGGTWRADGTIVFATSSGLYQVSEDGGEARLLAKPDPRRKERGYVWPQFMPDGSSVLFTVVPEDSIDGAQIALLDLKTLEVKTVLKGGTAARYTPSGHLVYASGQTLNAIAFDPDAGQFRGDPVSLPDIAIATALDNGAADFAVSETGTLLFISPNVADQQLRTVSWVDRHGKEEPLALAPDRYTDPRVSPDGTRVAFDIPGTNRDIWIWNLQRGSLTKLTGGPTEDSLPVWSSDGSRVFFASDRAGTFDLYSQAADGATKERVEFAGPGRQMPTAITPDGTRLLLIEDFKDVSMLTLARPDRVEPLLHSEFNEGLAVVSPDGNWIAYEADEAGDRTEIFLRPFPNVSGRREKVSIDGGRYPVWGRKGSGELFYVDLNGHMMAASVEFSPSLSLGRVTRLFDVEKPSRGLSGRKYDVSPVDGRFLITKTVTPSSDGTVNISVVLNWFEELRERVPLRTR